MSAILGVLKEALYIILAIFIFGFLILIHEFGHFSAARLFRVTVNEFSIGMGPKLFSKKSKKTGTAFSLRALPVGGFVSMAGEDEESDDENSLNKKPVIQRFIIMVAGSFMNLLLGVILVAVLVVGSGHIYGTSVGEFAEGAKTCEYGLETGDVITEINGHNVHTLYDLAYSIMRYCSEPAKLTVLRDGEEVTIEDVHFITSESDGVIYGLRDFYVDEEDFGFVSITKQVYYRSVTMVRMVYDSVYDLITGKYGIDDMSGPVGITKTITEAASTDDGGQTLIYLISLLAVNLGIMNLLPFPALDGFRALLLVFEGITKVKINKNIEGYINLIGLGLLMVLMIIVTFTDVTSLF